jgi:anti-anti-sigma factor
MNFPIAFSGTDSTVHITERLCVLEAVAFKEACKGILESTPRPQRLLLDFDHTVFMDSSGVGALVGVYKLAVAQNIDLVLQNVHPPVMSVLSLTSLDRLLKVESAISTSETDSGFGRNNRREDSLPPETHPSVRSKVKRAIDILGSLVGLGITAVLFLPIAIAIRLDSPGPILFSQTRCGWMGLRFRLWKFRSMVVDAEARRHEVKNEAEGAIFKNSNDPRITRIGRFLRRTSLDELPQFWNVLRGEMSLVGTRPPTPDEVDRYEVPSWQRLDVRPGMTGEWQVNGRSTVKNFEDIIRMDLAYQNNWNLKYDLQLIFKTIAIVFNKNSGAM